MLSNQKFLSFMNKKKMGGNELQLYTIRLTSNQALVLNVVELD